MDHQEKSAQILPPNKRMTCSLSRVSGDVAIAEIARCFGIRDIPDQLSKTIHGRTVDLRLENASFWNALDSLCLGLRLPASHLCLFLNRELNALQSFAIIESSIFDADEFPDGRLLVIASPTDSLHKVAMCVYLLFPPGIRCCESLVESFEVRSAVTGDVPIERTLVASDSQSSAGIIAIRLIDFRLDQAFLGDLIFKAKVGLKFADEGQSVSLSFKSRSAPRAFLVNGIQITIKDVNQSLGPTQGWDLSLVWEKHGQSSSPHFDLIQAGDSGEYVSDMIRFSAREDRGEVSCVNGGIASAVLNLRLICLDKLETRRLGFSLDWKGHAVLQKISRLASSTRSSGSGSGNIGQLILIAIIMLGVVVGACLLWLRRRSYQDSGSGRM